MMILELPWPPKELSPNARMHHMALYRHKKKYSEACGWIAKVKKPNVFVLDIPVKITFHPKRRGTDMDNCIASFKAGQDGIAKAWGVDDKRFKPAYYFGDPVKNGKIVFEVMELIPQDRKEK